MCWRCDIAQAVACRDYDPNKRAMLERGQAMVDAYMAEHGVGFEQAAEALAEERRREFAELRAAYAERHGLDDEQTLFALWAHGTDGPGGIQ